MKYSIKQIIDEQKSFHSYRYLILRNDKPIALFTHNHRGECESLVTLSDGKEHHLPFGQCSEFLIGGGSTPLELSENALVFIQSLI